MSGVDGSAAFQGRPDGSKWSWRRFVVFVLGGALVSLASVSLIAGLRGEGIAEQTPSGVAPTPLPEATGRPLVMTYFYLAPDRMAESGTFVHHPPDEPRASFANPAWFRKELSDMSSAGIDVALAVYRGPEPWGAQGLRTLATARSALVGEGRSVPQLGMFLDTTALLEARDLTSDEGKAWLARQVEEFFQLLPRHHWGLINGKPIVFLGPAHAAAFDQSTFDYVYDHFERTFSVRPYIVREVSWDYPVRLSLAGRIVRRAVDQDRPIRTENSYVWGAAQHGFADQGGVAVVSPGAGHSRVRGWEVFSRPRGEGRWYREHFEQAMASEKNLLVIETWNDYSVGSGVSETKEFGRDYLRITRELAERFHRRSQW